MSLNKEEKEEAMLLLLLLFFSFYLSIKFKSTPKARRDEMGIVKKETKLKRSQNINANRRPKDKLDTIGSTRSVELLIELNKNKKKQGQHRQNVYDTTSPADPN